MLGGARLQHLLAHAKTGTEGRLCHTELWHLLAHVIPGVESQSSRRLGKFPGRPKLLLLNGRGRLWGRPGQVG